MTNNGSARNLTSLGIESAASHIIKNFMPIFSFLYSPQVLLRVCKGSLDMVPEVSMPSDFTSTKNSFISSVFFLSLLHSSILLAKKHSRCFPSPLRVTRFSLTTSIVFPGHSSSSLYAILPVPWLLFSLFTYHYSPLNEEALTQRNCVILFAHAQSLIVLSRKLEPKIV